MLWIVIIYAKSGQLKSKNHRKSCDLYGWHALRGRSLSPGQRPGLFRMQTCRPVRAKALKLQGQLVKLLPLQGVLPIAIIPRALPWAKSFCPFRACCFYGLLSFTFALPFGQRFSIPLRAGDRWFWVCCFYGLLSFTFALPFGQRFSIPLRAGDRWFWVCCFYGLLPFTFALPFGQRFSIPLRAGDRWFRACCL